MTPAERLRAAGRDLLRRTRGNLPELAALLIGVLLRVSMAARYDARTGYDFSAHWLYVQYVANYLKLPSLTMDTASYHPPLYYFITGLMVRWGLGAGALGWLAALVGIARLVVIWAGLVRWLPEWRLARVIALLTASIIPASVQQDGMVTNEGLSGLLCALALVMAPQAVRASRSGEVRPALWLGLWLGLALMAKLSAAALIVAVLLAVVVDVVRGDQPLREALSARARPLLAGGLIIAALSGWFFMRNQILYGKPAPTGYDGWAKANQAPFDSVPLLDRRTLGFFVGFDDAVFDDPFFRKGYAPHPRFFSVLIASTFCDYYNYGYAAYGPGEPLVRRAYRNTTPRAVELGGRSVMAGAVIGLLTIAAWVGGGRALWRRRDDPRLFFPLALALATVGLIHFATKYPNDNFGPIKGAYFQFVAPVACALLGVAAAWAWRRVWTRAATLVACAALAAVMAYDGYARRPGVPVVPAPVFDPTAVRMPPIR